MYILHDIKQQNYTLGDIKIGKIKVWRPRSIWDRAARIQVHRPATYPNLPKTGRWQTATLATFAGLQLKQTRSLKTAADST